MHRSTSPHLRALFLITNLASLAAVTACGGGESSNPPAPSPAPVAPASTDVNAAYLAAIRQTHTYSLVGTTSTGTAVTASLSVAPGATASYNGSSYDTTTLTSVVNVGGAPASTASTTLWLQASTMLAFEAASADGTCLYVSAQSALPATASLGQVGPYVTATQYPGCSTPGTITTSDLSVGTVTETWSYTSIGGSGYVCLTSSDAEAEGTSTQEDCFQVTDTSGTLGARAQVTIRDLNGVTTTLITP